MLNDLYHAEYRHKEYERRIKAGLLLHAALKESAEQTDATAPSLSQRLQVMIGWAITRWRRGQQIVCRWSGGHKTVLSSPINHEG